jgi:hypothetical protein
VTHHLDLSTLRLASGAHPDNPEQGCVMEWVGVFAGLHEPGAKEDHPACTSPVLTAFAFAWNDGLDDANRQRLIPYIPRLVGTAGDPEADERRAWIATDWLARRPAPAWPRKAGLTARATELAALPASTSAELAEAAPPNI